MKIRNAYLTKLTKKEKIEDLIRSIRPVVGDVDLIRLGGNTDGGYLVPDDLQGLKACFSPGVGNETSFELDCIKKGINVYLADASVEKPENLPSSCSFRSSFLGAFNSDQSITLDSWVKSEQVNPDDDLILQMDIEGAEYEVLLSTTEELLKQFRIIVFEVHGLDQWWNAPFFNLVSCAFRKLNQNHICVHNHPNTLAGIFEFGGLQLPRRIELTFHRKDRVINREYRTDFPHPLDYDNSSNSSLKLPSHWYQQGEGSQ